MKAPKELKLFSLRVPTYRGEPPILINVYDDGYDNRGAQKILAEVKQGGKTIFPYGELYGALSPSASSDGNEAKEHALALVGMKPGDTDAEYFESYSPEQKEWARKYGELISMYREDRFCDANGNPKRDRLPRWQRRRRPSPRLTSTPFVRS